jgi:AcrR family transcriptional regulator
MAESFPAVSGIRERKKVRTREALIEAAAELCLRRGYDNTTVEQIAAAADVSTRTFSRYFPTKGAVIVAIADDIDVSIAAALSKQPDDITEYEALLRAHLAVFGAELNYVTPVFRRMAAMIQIVNGSESMRASALAQKDGVSNNAALEAMARRMGVPLDHPAIRVIGDTWTMLFAASFDGLGLPGNEPVEPKVVCDRLRATFELFRRSWTPWKGARRESVVAGQPPASASG